VADHIFIQAAGEPLVSIGSISEAIAQDDPVRCQSGADYFRHMLCPGRCIQQQFRRWHHGVVIGIQENRANLVGYRAAARLTGKLDRVVFSAQQFGNPLNLGRFAATFNAFKCDETAHIVMSPKSTNYREFDRGLASGKILINTHIY
jgi:hypothetical protein